VASQEALSSVSEWPQDWRGICNSLREMRSRNLIDGMKHRFCAVVLKNLYSESETEENLK
jgi:hypothetical protein